MMIPVENMIARDDWSGSFLKINVYSTNHIGPNNGHSWPVGDVLIKKKDVRMVTDDCGTTKVYTEEYEFIVNERFNEIQAKLNFEREIDE